MIQFDPSLYQPLFLYSLLVVTLCYFSQLQSKDDDLIYENSNNLLILFYIFAFVIIQGWRPPSGHYFGDSSNYANIFNNYQIGINIFDPDSDEWLFSWLTYYCSKITDVNGYFLIVEIFYVIPAVLAARKLIPNHYILLFIGCMGAFSFYSYGVNGIRNGMACSLIILAISCVNDKVKGKIIAVALAYLAFNIHKSTALPILCVALSYFVKDTRYTLYFWLSSIFISLVAGGAVEAFFTGLGFDDRMSSYSSANADASVFSSTGFRWDFLLYSSMPILMGYYVVIKRKIWDENYLLLLNSYILCNSFWVMMIRASYSNRFAYLSWFMYTFVLLYPCLKFPLWDDQGKKTGQILLAHLGFTLFMDL